MSEDSYNLRYPLPSRCIEKGFRSGHCLHVLALSAWSGAYDSVLALDGKLRLMARRTCTVLLHLHFVERTTSRLQPATLGARHSTIKYRHNLQTVQQ